MNAELAPEAGELSTLAEQIRQLKQWLSDTEGMLEKVMAHLSTQQQVQWSEMTPAQIILSILKGRTEPVELRELKLIIERLGVEKSFGHKFNYFYILIKRLESSGKIQWEGDGIRLKQREDA